MPVEMRPCNPCVKGPAGTYQDQQYGKNMRVHNVSGKNDTRRCTVCGNVKSS